MKRLEVTGPAVGLVSDVMQAASIAPVTIDTGAGQFAVSESGSLIYVTGGVFPQDHWSIVWVDRSGRSEALNVPPGSYGNLRLSPDGKRVAFNSASGDWDLWTYDIPRRISARMRMDGEQRAPKWTPDGSRLAFSSFVRGKRSLLLVSPDGTGPAEPLTTMDVTAGTGGDPASWTPDGSTLAMVFQGDIWVLPRDRKTEPRRLVRGTQPDFSPDGRWLAYSSGSLTRVSGDPEQSQVYVQPYPALDTRVRVSTENGRQPAWRHDGREMYYTQEVSGDGRLRIRMMAVPLTTTPTFSAGTPQMLFEGAFRTGGPNRNYDVTPDGQRFLMTEEISQPPAHVAQMVLVENWVEELKARVPLK